MESDTDKCWRILPGVSRSFALCIKILPSPLNKQMMVSYLIFRVMDTIEDSSIPVEEKKALFLDFLNLLSPKKPNFAAAEACSKKMLATLNYTYEKELLESLSSLLNAYFSLPLNARKAICRKAKTMAQGMCKFQEKAIETFKDQNRYSYYVAGIIGHLFNDLLELNGIISKKLKRTLSKYALKFGLALQKINILRDIAEDIASKRYYWPQKVLAKYGLNYSNLCCAENRDKALAVLQEHIKDARKYIRAAMKYILLLPKNALRVRMFCIIPLFMAIESYAKCIGNAEIFLSEKKVKITREQVNEIVAKSSLWGSDNSKLVEWFYETVSKTAQGKELRYLLRI